MKPVTHTLPLPPTAQQFPLPTEPISPHGQLPTSTQTTGAPSLELLNALLALKREQGLTAAAAHSALSPGGNVTNTSPITGHINLAHSQQRFSPLRPTAAPHTTGGEDNLHRLLDQVKQELSTTTRVVISRESVLGTLLPSGYPITAEQSANNPLATLQALSLIQTQAILMFQGQPYPCPKPTQRLHTQLIRKCGKVINLMLILCGGLLILSWL